MKKLSTNIDFADSEYISCKTNGGDLIIYLKSWDDKTIIITFSNAIRFIFRGGDVIADFYEIFDESLFLLEALSSYYEKIPEHHPFKVFLMLDIEDHSFFEVVSEKISFSKE